MNRKYRQQGYMNEDREPRQRRPSRRTSREGPRSPRMMKFQKVSRCAQCAKTLPPGFTEIELDSKCPHCNADLHTCKNCSFFDPSSRLECSEPIPERVVQKDQANLCPYFEAKTTVEKATTSSKSQPSADPREAFERLFKK